MADQNAPYSLRDTARLFARTYTTKILHDLRDAIAEGLPKEDALPPGVPKRFGYREHSDFRTWCEALEEELRQRGEGFTPVDWTPPTR